jgi:peptide deformylase
MEFNGRLRLLLYGPDIVNVVSHPVVPSEFDELPRLLEYMTKVMRHCKGVGLSAPQVGVFKNFLIYERLDRSVFGLVNPMIERMLGKELDQEEESLSIPPVGNGCRVPRMEMVLVKASTVKNPFSIQTFKLVGSDARIVQQQLDCLTGTFFVDRVPEKRKRVVLENYRSWQHNWEAAGRPFPY